MGKIEPFPWSALDRVSAAKARALSQARRQIAPSLPGLSFFADQCSRLLGCPVSLDVADTSVADELKRRPGRLGVAFSLGDGAPGFALIIEHSLALRLAALVAGHPVEWVNGARPLDPEVAAAASAFLVVLARRTLGVPWLVAAGGLAAKPLVCVRVVVSIDGDVFEATIAVPLAPVPPPPASFDIRALAALGDLPLALPVVASVECASDADIEGLVPGAAWAWAPSETTWTAHRDPNGAWQGTVQLVAPSSEIGLEAHADAASGVWRLGAERRFCPAEVSPPAEAGEGGVLRTVRVEVGEVRLAARAWAKLSPGAPLPVFVRDVVTLRVGGEAVARGHIDRLNGKPIVLIEEAFHGERRQLSSDKA